MRNDAPVWHCCFQPVPETIATHDPQSLVLTLGLSTPLLPYVLRLLALKCHKCPLRIFNPLLHARSSCALTSTPDLLGSYPSSSGVTLRTPTLRANMTALHRSRIVTDQRVVKHECDRSGYFIWVADGLNDCILDLHVQDYADFGLGHVRACAVKHGQEGG